MTAIDLLNALKAYMEDKVKDMRLIARVPENGTDPGATAVSFYRELAKQGTGKESSTLHTS